MASGDPWAGAVERSGTAGSRGREGSRKEHTACGRTRYTEVTAAVISSRSKLEMVLPKYPSIRIPLACLWHLERLHLGAKSLLIVENQLNF